MKTDSSLALRSDPKSCDTQTANLNLQASSSCTIDSDTSPRVAELPSISLTVELNELNKPYDAWVLAGGRLFRAHANILCAHSPYLRASISALGETRLLLPHVPAAGFSAVLAYMYTGRLSLTQAPVYEILLTGHLLQMPSVIGLCQVLMTTHTDLQSPVALSSLFGYTEDASNALTQLPPALTTWRSLAQLVPTARDSAPVETQPTLVRPTPTRPINCPPIEKRSIEPESRQTSLNNKNGLLHAERYVFSQFKNNASNIASSSDELKGNRTKLISSTGASFVMDIAACDGPVFFERVINKAFKNNSDQENMSDSDESEINVVDTSVASSDHTTANSVELNVEELKSSRPQMGNGLRTYHCVYCNNTFKSHYCYQKHMRRHINPITIEENCERSEVLEVTPDKDSPSVISSVEGTSQVTTTIPSTVESKPDGSNGIRSHARGIIEDSSLASPESSCGSNFTAASDNMIMKIRNPSKLRVLDLNVQYFPCKTCGSKFPSYYFVHKHRRMCHGEEEDQSKDLTSSSSLDSLPIANKQIGEEKPVKKLKTIDH